MGEQRQLHPKTLTHLVAVCSALLVAFSTWNIPDTFWLVIGMGFEDFGLSFHTSGFS